MDLSCLEDPSVNDEDLLKKLISLPGIGPFSAANMLQLLGRYQRIACDSETVRHFRDHHKKTGCNSSNVEATAAKVCCLHCLNIETLTFCHHLILLQHLVADKSTYASHVSIHLP